MNYAKELMKRAHRQQSFSQVVEEPSPVDKSPILETPKKKKKDIPSSVKYIARKDVDIDSYGVKPVATNFNCYNKELFDFLRNFSSSNQFNGGVAITKSQVIEIALDVILYDLEIKPIGYESQQALREDIQRKIKETSRS